MPTPQETHQSTLAIMKQLNIPPNFKPQKLITKPITIIPNPLLSDSTPIISSNVKPQTQVIKNTISTPII